MEFIQPLLAIFQSTTALTATLAFLVAVGTPYFAYKMKKRQDAKHAHTAELVHEKDKWTDEISEHLVLNPHTNAQSQGQIITSSRADGTMRIGFRKEGYQPAKIPPPASISPLQYRIDGGKKRTLPMTEGTVYYEDGVFWQNVNKDDAQAFLKDINSAKEAVIRLDDDVVATLPIKHTSKGIKRFWEAHEKAYQSRGEQNPIYTETKADIAQTSEVPLAHTPTRETQEETHALDAEEQAPQTPASQEAGSNATEKEQRKTGPADGRSENESPKIREQNGKHHEAVRPNGEHKSEHRDTKDWGDRHDLSR